MSGSWGLISNKCSPLLTSLADSFRSSPAPPPTDSCFGEASVRLLSHSLVSWLCHLLPSFCPREV